MGGSRPARNMAANQAEDWKKAFTPASLREPESRSRVRSMNRAEGLASRKEKARRAKPVKARGNSASRPEKSSRRPQPPKAQPQAHRAG